MGSSHSPEKPYNPVEELESMVSEWLGSLSKLEGSRSVSMDDAIAAFEGLFARRPRMPLHNNVLLLFTRKSKQAGGSPVEALRSVESTIRGYMGLVYSGIERVCEESVSTDVVIVSRDLLTLACARGILRRGERVYAALHALAGPDVLEEGGRTLYFHASFLYHVVRLFDASILVPAYSVSKMEAAAPPLSLEATVIAGDLGRRVVLVAPRLSIDPFFGPLSSIHAPRVVIEEEIGYSYTLPAFEVIKLSSTDLLLTEKGPVEASFEGLLEVQGKVINELLQGV
ncbi:MAG: hypothetical protein LRS43_00600 [Desulfurococcales archaeon]|nr:hypothetical protein [Desulfurococcales archaeon]